MMPELLAPAGSPAALEAAISAGADAVYFGGQSFNARKNADNFASDELAGAIRRCRLFGVKTNIVLNTALYGGELLPAVSFAEMLLSYGADAFIVADIGLAALLKETFPEIILHASTQACGENVLSAAELAKIGFSRMVAPRELPLRDIRTLCAESPIETEIFVHGALCVSHSGQCLMSSIIGGRSGNRGECAQPCRLPYRTRHPYPLSLKDLCLAAHMPEILDAGVASLKIEGRMKSAEYVYGVVSVYRRLIDERRAATPEEMRALSALFSRSGFTDGYFTERISCDMLGVRTEADKRETEAVKSEKMAGKKLPLSLSGEFLVGHPSVLRGTVRRGADVISAEVSGEAPVRAEKTPTGEDRLRENLSKLGATIFYAADVQVKTDDANIPISAVNALRRALCEKLETALAGTIPPLVRREAKTLPAGFVKSGEKSAFFVYFDSITPRAFSCFDRIFVPLSEYLSHAGAVSHHPNVGVSLPPVCFDHELVVLRRMLADAVAAGCQMALVSGFWQAALADEFGLIKHGDLRLNVFNAASAEVYRNRGFASLILSPEVGTSAARSLASGIPKGYVIYGRLPLMTLEKCVIRDNFADKTGGACRYCDTRRFSSLTDRTGAKFPICREFPHRNVLYNSVPLYMADKPIGGLFCHSIFTDETAEMVDHVIDCMEKHLPPQGKFKRLP